VVAIVQQLARLPDASGEIDLPRTAATFARALAAHGIIRRDESWDLPLRSRVRLALTTRGLALAALLDQLDQLGRDQTGTDTAARIEMNYGIYPF
jgi:hypothetical protein